MAEPHDFELSTANLFPSLYDMRFLSLLTLISAASAMVVVRQTNHADELKKVVSTPAGVNVEMRARWSEFGAPKPAIVVKVQQEKDIAAIVSRCC